MGESCKFAHTGEQQGSGAPRSEARPAYSHRCRHWAIQGKCNLGDECKFEHTGTPGDTEWTPPLPRPDATPSMPPHPMGGHSRAPYGRPPPSNAPPSAYMHNNNPFAPSYPPPQGPPHHGGGPPPHAFALYGMPEQGKSHSVCRHFSRGNCNLGYSCHFSHVAVAKTEEEKRTDQPCRHWLRGSCRLGAVCHFVHTEADKGTKVWTPPEGEGEGEPGEGQAGPSGPPPTPAAAAAGGEGQPTATTEPAVVEGA